MSLGPRLQAVRTADLIGEAAVKDPRLVLCCATGSTPTAAYRLLVTEPARVAQLAGVRVVKLDEWVGLPPDHPSSCEDYLRKNLLGSVPTAPASSARSPPCPGHSTPCLRRQK